MNIDKICEQLTIDEKIRLLGGVGDWHTYDCNGKIPSIMMTDGPHGIRKLEQEKVGDIETSKPATCFPTASAIACSWNPAIVKKMGEAIAKEAKKEQISIVLGCGINIKRSPLCGRNFEYFSEDPYLTGKLATGYIEGVQSLGIGTSLKHYAVNSQETRRMTSNSQIDERTFREIYLSAFEEVVKKAKPTSVMASYNRINGEFGARNKYLLTDVLRKDYFLNLTVKSDKPVVLVGAMRPSTALSADGPLNLYNAVVTAAAKESKDKGVLVAMNGLILGAESVVKMNTVDVQTFQAPNSGALGYVLNGKVCYNQITLKKHTTQSVFDVTKLTSLPKVGIVYSYSNIEADMMTPLLNNGYKGIIHAGVGNGNIHKNIFPSLIDARRKGIVVVRSSRVPTGPTTLDAEVDDAKYQFVASQELNPQKSRVLLMLALTKTTDWKQIQEYFNEY